MRWTGHNVNKSIPFEVAVDQPPVMIPTSTLERLQQDSLDGLWSWRTIPQGYIPGLLLLLSTLAERNDEKCRVGLDGTTGLKEKFESAEVELGLQ